MGLHHSIEEWETACLSIPEIPKQDITESTLETWQSIREKDILALYERTKAAGGYSGPYGPFRRYVTQADLGAPFIEILT